MNRTPDDARYRPVPGDTQTDNKGGMDEWPTGAGDTQVVYACGDDS